jgi:hypothetical protein
MIILWFSGATATFCLGLRTGFFDRVVCHLLSDKEASLWQAQAACLLAVAIAWPLVAIDIMRGV